MFFTSKKSSGTRILSGCLRLVFFSLLAAAFASATDLPPVLITDCGTTITAPGNYILANDLNCGGPVAPTVAPPAAITTAVGAFSATVQELQSRFAGANAPTPNPPGFPGFGILIEASHVNLMLNGHTVNGGGAGGDSFAGIIAAPIDTGTPISHLTIIGPGRVTGWDIGVILLVVSFSTIKDVTADHNIFGLSTGLFIPAPCFPDTCAGYKNHILGNTATNNALGILAFLDTDSAFRDNNASNNAASFNNFFGGGIGIALFGTAREDVRFNTANNNDLAGIANQSGTDNTYYLNTAQNNAQLPVAPADVTSTTGDLVDFDDACGTSTWKHNTFGTANQPCIH